MSEFMRINAARPGKIIAMLDVIAASARSNKATPDEVATLLAPVRECLRDFADVAPVGTEIVAPSSTQPITAHDGVLVCTLRRALEHSTPEQITAALAWIVSHNNWRK